MYLHNPQGAESSEPLCCCGLHCLGIEVNFFSKFEIILKLCSLIHHTNFFISLCQKQSLEARSKRLAPNSLDGWWSGYCSSFREL